MRTYLIYDRASGEVLYTLIAPGPVEIAATLLDDLIENGWLERATLVEVHPSNAHVRFVIDGGRSLLSPGRPASATSCPSGTQHAI